MQHIRKTHNVNIKTARLFSEKAYKDIIIIKHTNPTNNDKWELKPHSNENINISNKHGKIVFQCPLVRCKSKLKHIPSVIDHLNRVHKIPRGLHLKNIIKHAQKTFVEKKGLTKIHFSREYPCIEIICEERFEHETQLEKHKLTNHKCENCNITCDNATNLDIHIAKDIFRNCLEFYLNKNQKKHDERKRNMKDNKIYKSRNLQELITICKDNS